MAYIGNKPAAVQTVDLKWDTGIKTANFTAEAGRGYWINTTSGAVTVTLPGSANTGDTISIVDYARKWGTNAVTINTNSLKFQGNTSPNPVYDTSGQSVDIVYSGATQGWIPNSDDVVSLETPQSVDVQYLVVAGGAAGGGYYAGGGGAGGLLTSTLSGLAIGVTLTATVGAGGAAVSHGGAGVRGNNGVNSTLAGSGFTTVTCIAGGGGGADNSGTGNSGGSGGGGSQQGSSAGGSGTVGQGNNGGSSTASAPDYGSAGGGGAGAVGGNANNVAGDGGVGLSNSITGSAVFYAGGGGGSSEETATGGAGGNGGGGASGDSGSEAGTAGTANTGGGGGGANQTQASGAGGSGVVILRVLTDVYSGTSTGSPTVTTDGSHTVIKFTGNGTYTT